MSWEGGYNFARDGCLYFLTAQANGDKLGPKINGREKLFLSFYCLFVSITLNIQFSDSIYPESF